ncbi:phosphoribosyl-ATP diphosphatase, partial [Salmonella enterica subsp. enterica serovar Kentucky]|nr:phosphoribosyl-ATP diphosphatase [Salmonella enterica subsp. enterica serovar Kentucky]
LFILKSRTRLPSAWISLGCIVVTVLVVHKNSLVLIELWLLFRKTADPASSYTAKLYASGTKRIAQKVGEEGVETALAATVNDR